MKRTCPNCRNPVSASATNCPNCGSPLRPPNPIAEPPAPESQRAALRLCIVVLGGATILYGVLACPLFLVLALRTAKSLPQIWQADVVLPALLALLGAALLAAGVGLLLRKKWSLQVISAGTLGTVIIAGVGLLIAVGVGRLPTSESAWVSLAMGAAFWMILVVVGLKLPRVQKLLDEL